jgi:hypothetical protein
MLSRQRSIVRGPLWGALLDALLDASTPRYNNRDAFVLAVLELLFAHGSELPVLRTTHVQHPLHDSHSIDVPCDGSARHS